MSSTNASLESAATERKARLAKLAALKRKQPEPESLGDATVGDEEPTDDAQDIAKTYLSGRNYDPETRGPKLGFEQAPTDGRVTLEQQASEIARIAAEQDEKDEEAEQPIDLFKLQPKKPNWDLKRYLDEKTRVLNVRTENAIAKLVRERIENAQRAGREKPRPSNADEDGEEVGIEGEALVEGIHVREQEADSEDEDTI